MNSSSAKAMPACGERRSVRWSPEALDLGHGMVVWLLVMMIRRRRLPRTCHQLVDCGTRAYDQHGVLDGVHSAEEDPPICTSIGAFPGAMPPVLGWTAIRGRLDLGSSGPLRDPFLLAIPALPFDRVALSRRLRECRDQDAAGRRARAMDARPRSPSSRTRSSSSPR